MRECEVGQFWKIYKSKEFKKELKYLFKKIEAYSEIQKLKQQHDQKVIALILNRSSSFISKAYKLYIRFKKSQKKKLLNCDQKVSELLIRIPKYQRLYYILEDSKLTVQDFLNLRRFWLLPLKGCGPKNFAFLAFCLEQQGLIIRKARWCRK